MQEVFSNPFSTLLRTAPAAVLYGCVILLVLWIGCLAYLLWSSHRLQRDIRSFTSALHPFRRSDHASARAGLNLERLDSIRKYGNALSDRAKQWWSAVNGHIEPYSNSEDRDMWFLTQRAREILPYEVVVSKNFNGTLLGAVPSILTGIGLTLTFVAILLGLLGVHYDKANTIEPISGIDSLINGLSGKFLSSIVALLLSIVFTLIERVRIRSLRTGYENLLVTLSEAIPLLSPSRILLDIQRSSAKASVSVSHISSEVVDRLLNGFNERVVPALALGMSSSVGDVFQSQLSPTLNRMTGSLDDLQKSIVRLETQKQESVTGELGQLLAGLERSLTAALTGMAERFHEALSGSARQEFGNVQSTLEGARQMLGDMNGQFAGMQAAFTAVVARAEQTTSDQLNAGREQTEALSAVMRGLMTQLQENASQNLNTMQTQLTRVVNDLAAKVGSLSNEMLDAARSLTDHSQQSATAVMEKTDEWSQATSKRLETLLVGIEDRSKDFKEASAALLEAKTFVNNLLMENGKALAQMAQASQSVHAYSTELRGQSEAMKAIGTGHVAIVGQLRGTVDSMKAGMEQHQSLLVQYRSTFTEYRTVIDGLHEPLARIMRTTSDGLRDYNEKVHENFDGIVKIADKLVPQAANMLNAQIEELKEQLEELSEVISKAVGGLNGRAH
jgi:hypothetical protein